VTLLCSELIMDVELGSPYEANGKAKLRHRLRQAVKKAVAQGAEVEANYSEFTGGFNQRAALMARAKQALLLEFASFTEDEKWEFTTCQRTDGSLYGTGGKCRKGTEVSEDQAALQRAANRKRATGRYGGSLKRRLAEDPEIQHLARQHRKLEKAREKTKGELKRAADELKQDRWNTNKREAYRRAEQRANTAYTAAERCRSELKRREREIRRQHEERNRPALARQKDLPDFPPDWPTGRQLG
jgi:hypothetical protein